MLPYINELSQEEQEKLQEMIRRLFRQTFLLERKYDKKAGRMVADKDFYFADRHMDFLKDYFAAAGICLEQNTELGTIYLTGETTMGERIPKLATIYLLLLKLIYDEQMAAVFLQREYCHHLRRTERQGGRVPAFPQPFFPYGNQTGLCLSEEIPDGGTDGCPG